MTLPVATTPLGAEHPPFESIAVRTHSSMRSIGRERWQTLTGLPVPPHLSFEWLDALETSGAVSPERGWLPLHLTVESGGRLLAASPCYLRGDSSGEFVFDQTWATFAERSLGLRYYPKLVLAVPFTPATGPRVLTAAGFPEPAAIMAIHRAVGHLVDTSELSSAHVLFPNPNQAGEFADRGWQTRHSLQFHWWNRGYRSFDDFLGDFSSKRRNQIRRERRSIAERGIRVEVLDSSKLSSECAELAYRLYLSTVDKFFYGRRYLNQRFFETVFDTMPASMMLVLARDARDRVIAGALNLVGAEALYGRYWGSFEAIPFLHFECCYYRGVQESIARGLVRFEPGAGGEHKLSRGFQPTVVRSCHWLRDHRLSGAVSEFVQREREVLRAHREEAALHCGLRPAARAPELTDG